MAFPIVEYEVCPEVNFQPEWHLDWHSKMAIDLRWVAAVKPYHWACAILIILCGSSSEIAICAEYEDFMRDWVRAKGL